jgi:hypothetical protein
MDDMEEVPGVYGEFTDNTRFDPAFGEIEILITQDPMAISRAFRLSVLPA